MSEESVTQCPCNINIDDENPYQTRQLPCLMTLEEHRDMGQLVARLVGEAEDLEAEKKSTVSSYNAKRDRLAERIQTLSRTLRAGTVDREVEVMVRNDLVLAEQIVHRLDTGEVIERRTLTRAELQELRQPKLPNVDAAPPADDGLDSIWAGLGPADAEHLARELVDEIMGDPEGKGEPNLASWPAETLRTVFTYAHDHRIDEEHPVVKAVGGELGKRAAKAKRKAQMRSAPTEQPDTGAETEPDGEEG